MKSITEEVKMECSLGRIVIYTKKVEKMAAFYQRFFGFEIIKRPGDRIVELVQPKTGISIMLHEAAKSVKTGQVIVKLVFDVKDVEGFRKQSAKMGLKFGTIHHADGYSFANAKDPDKNSISISSRKFVRR